MIYLNISQTPVTSDFKLKDHDAKFDFLSKIYGFFLPFFFIYNLEKGAMHFNKTSKRSYHAAIMTNL